MAQNDCSGLENGMLQWRLPSEHGQHHDKSPKARPSRERPQKTRNGSNWASGGPGMQAIFLGSNRTCGTGVFLPRREGSDVQLLTNKPAFSPVLLPSRVVQTLNLNVYEVGKQMKPQTDQPKNTAKRNEKSEKNKKLYDVYSSPEIFLPKEWTY